MPMGKNATRATPKGRQVDPAALAEMRALLGDAPRRRDLLIEHLHAIQDRFGCISAAHLAALADEMRLAMAEVYEVATFYAHFDMVREGEAAPPALTIRVCDSLSCEMAGGRELLDGLAGALRGKARVERAPCMGLCDRAPAAQVGGCQIASADRDKAVAAAAAAAHPAPMPESARRFDAYAADGGYALLKDCLAG
ncbi:MAG: NADH-quinone oxidoreductase subunit F, partial [Alphaproteobacteria bacterium]|nr:NADH-quinone oxidoreductase subunit F [Alphaproteobacteria bacterium]